jgi:hypothetical protein
MEIYFMFKLIMAGIAGKSGYETIPHIYNFFASKSKLSDKRKVEIEERRGRLKIESDDPKILSIVIEGILTYKPGPMTLDDRYLQLEQILDAIDKAKTTKRTENLTPICEKIAKDIASSPGKFKNAFLECLQTINLRIQAFEGFTPKAKL